MYVRKELRKEKCGLIKRLNKYFKKELKPTGILLLVTKKIYLKNMVFKNVKFLNTYTNNIYLNKSVFKLRKPIKQQSIQSVLKILSYYNITISVMDIFLIFDYFINRNKSTY